ncbi:MAG: 50S ribosomal protein L18 [Thermodesulfobacteriota bacterium]
MLTKLERKSKSRRRRIRVRKKIFGTLDRPRLSVHRSNKHIYAQMIDDVTGKTLVSASTLSRELRVSLKSTGTVEAAALVGTLLAQRAREAQVTRVVFDRNQYRYHGRVKALAEAARQGGLEF